MIYLQFLLKISLCLKLLLNLNNSFRTLIRFIENMLSSPINNNKIIPLNCSRSSFIKVS